MSTTNVTAGHDSVNQPSPRKHKWLRAIIALVVLVVVATAVWSGVAFYQINNAFLKGETRLFTVKKGVKARDLLPQMTDTKVSPFWSMIWLKLHPEYNDIKAGSYMVHKGWYARQALALFVSGKEAVFSVTLVEGQRIEDWLETLSHAQYLVHTPGTMDLATIRERLNIPQTNIEGWFLPETYAYTAESTTMDILRRAHLDMESFLEKAWKNRDQNIPLKTPYEALIMASIIEKETAKASERPQIASVFMNRLRKNMKLQTDPTVIYGVRDHYDGTIHRSDLDDNNPYNTYQIYGLPPTPIAMPSKASIQAALHPAKTNYLYFVAKGGGAHQFSTNLADHNRAVQRYLAEH